VLSALQDEDLTLTDDKPKGNSSEKKNERFRATESKRSTNLKEETLGRTSRSYKEEG